MLREAASVFPTWKAIRKRLLSKRRERLILHKRKPKNPRLYKSKRSALHVKPLLAKALDMMPRALVEKLVQRKETKNCALHGIARPKRLSARWAALLQAPKKEGPGLPVRKSWERHLQSKFGRFLLLQTIAEKCRSIRGFLCFFPRSTEEVSNKNKEDQRTRLPLSVFVSVPLSLSTSFFLSAPKRPTDDEQGKEIGGAPRRGAAAAWAA